MYHGINLENLVFKVICWLGLLPTAYQRDEDMCLTSYFLIVYNSFSQHKIISFDFILPKKYNHMLVINFQFNKIVICVIS